MEQYEIPLLIKEHRQISISVESLSKSYDGKEVLSNLSFKILKGETVGVIGPNGAGKSTLLKILSDIVRPDSGSVTLNGAVSSILEIGMGLHPDLSGSENVFFAGQLMGRSKKEIQLKFDEIVSFSELQDHMEKPVKQYSNGMYLRLAFSIYTLLDSDILLLDEVLSVGDASFRKKSFQKMLEYRDTDKTVILVSHGLTEIESFCDRIIYLDTKIKADSNKIREVLLKYISDHPLKLKSVDESWLTVSTSSTANGAVMHLPSNENLKVLEIYASTLKNVAQNTFFSSDSIRLVLRYEKLNDHGDLSFIWKLFDMNDAMLFATSPLFDENYGSDENTSAQVREEVTVLPKYFLNTGRYYLSLVCGIDRKPIATYHSVLSFSVQQDTWIRNESWSAIPAPILHKFEWQRKPIKGSEKQ